MQSWQKDINAEVAPSIGAMIKQLREKHPDHGFGLNYNLIFPKRFAPGGQTSIPITIPSKEGLYQLGDVVITTDLESVVQNVGINVPENIGPWDPSRHDSGDDGITTVTDTLSSMSEFFDDCLGVMRSDQIQRLMTPKTAFGRPLENFSGFGTPTVSNGTNVPVVQGVSARGGQRQGGRALPWDQVNTSRRKAEASRAEKIVTKDQRESFIQEALDNTAYQPYWYAALGGQSKEKIRARVTKAYTDKCMDIGKTMLPSDFLEALRLSMAKAGQLAPYCVAAKQTVPGTAENTCLNKDCSVYSPNCEHLSYRLRPDILS